jgi:hypothetical protein
VHPTLSGNDMSNTARAVEKVFEAATSIPYSEIASA